MKFLMSLEGITSSAVPLSLSSLIGGTPFFTIWIRRSSRGAPVTSGETEKTNNHTQIAGEEEQQK
jgi:hypothetical protein